MCGRICVMGETKTTRSGKLIKNFSIAINKKASQKGGQNPSTTFINCVAWEAQAKILGDYFAVGDHICVKGMLENGAYVKGDIRLTITQVCVKSIYFVEKRSNKNASTETSQPQQAEQAVPELPPEADPWATNPWQEEVFF